VNGSGQVLENWEEIKKKEKEGRTVLSTPLREIPRELPALTRASKVIKKVDKLYEVQGDYQSAVEALRQAAEKLAAITPEDYSSEIVQEMGDALMALSNISRLCKLSPEQILDDRIEGMIAAFEGLSTEV
jgi:tetrapyrrole methylase family protein/MazG family protein